MTQFLVQKYTNTVHGDTSERKYYKIKAGSKRKILQYLAYVVDSYA